MTQVIAHRGASRAETENTLAAFRRAVEMGADGIELDVRRTADDHMIIHHDAVLPDGRTIREIRAADLPVHVPDLAAALDACEGAFVNIEIKNSENDPDFDPTEWVTHRVIGELQRRSDDNRWLVSSFRPRTVRVAKRAWPRLRTALLTYDCGPEEIGRAVRDRHVAIHPWVGSVDEASVRAAHAEGLLVNVWTCNEPEAIGELIAWGVDGICTDVPDVGLTVRRSVA